MTATHRPCRGFTLVEAAIATLIVGGMLVAALQAAGAAVLTQQRAAVRTTARSLADGMLAEVLRLPYADRDLPVFGREAAEQGGVKTSCDDVDDFHGWTESPPQDLAGNALAELSGWERRVKVEWVQSSDASTASFTDTGLKRITVTILHRGDAVATAVGLRSREPE
jgi:type II secretory pathway pseudopilin PulG